MTSSPAWLRCLLAAAALCAGDEPDATGSPNAGRAAAVDFTRQIRPLLSDRCFPCHGPDAGARESALRLDSLAGATADLGGYAAVVPGQPGQSRLVERVRHSSAESRMPPADSKLGLSADEIELLERWIAEGAAYPEHWALLPPRRAEPPVVEHDDWSRDDIDRFVLARLTAAGLVPSPEADRATWLRRVSFDLTGLPPTVAELDAFLADELPDGSPDGSPDAFERVVDRLLASPCFGERMAVDWLDVARYADSYGYQNDLARDVWPWRDWVIDAFNRDLPWDDFVTWQLAGDLLPGATREQRLATTFNRLHRQTNEGGSVEQEFRIEYVADRVNTFATAFLGLTLECARCHDHKFDPILQSEYYGLAAFFDNIDESGLYSHFTEAVPTPTLMLPSAEQAARLDELRAAVAEAQAALDRATLEDTAAAEAWAAELRSGDSLTGLTGLVGAFDFESLVDDELANAADPGHPGQVSDAHQLVPGRAGHVLQLSGEDKARFPGLGAFGRDDPFTIALWLDVPDDKQRAVVFHRSEAWTDAASQGYELLLEDGRLSAALIHFWPGDALRVRALHPLPVGRWVHVTVSYDGSSRAAGLFLFVDGVRQDTLVVRDQLVHTILDDGVTLTLGQRFRDVGLVGGQVDELAVFDRCLSAPEIVHLATGAALPAALARSLADAVAYHRAVVDTHLAALREELRVARRALSEHVDAIPRIMVMDELETPRATHRLVRGSYLAPAERVDPTTPERVAPFGDARPPNRLGLADWLVAPENPLFARVAVNRLWALVFGQGLVPTVEDFGSQGEPPGDPELLDQLALALRDDGWSVKRMLKRLVLSASYRQSSRADSELTERDPGNRLLARGPRRRLSAEMLRDNALCVSGLLVERRGGPPVKPYQPPGLWREKGDQTYVQDEGEGLWRRSLYSFWKRTSPPPSMMILDAAKRDVCVARRQSTSSPLQALLLWNDPQLVEAARALAERVLREAPAADAARVRHAFRSCTSREPDESETAVLVELLAHARAEYGAHPERAAELLAVGASEPDPALDASEVASWAIVANALLSFDGTVVLR